MDTSAIQSATAEQITTWYSEGVVSPVEVLDVALGAAEAAGSRYAAVSTLIADQARRDAEDSAERWRRCEPRGELDGVPVSVKDSIAVKGVKSWSGSVINDHLPPDITDAPPVRRLREAGAVIFAKTTMPDLGLIGAGISSQFGIIRNPWNPEFSPGGSSSGAGALLSAGGGALSVGTDLGGSIRYPAGLCGLVGFKPTQGLVANTPPALVVSAGPMARNVADAARLLRVIAQPDVEDHLSLPGGFQGGAAAPRDLRGVTVGVITQTQREYGLAPEIVEVVRRQAALLESCGAAIVEITEPICTEEEDRIVAEVLLTRALPMLLAASSELFELLPDALVARFTGFSGTSAMDHVTHEANMETVRAAITKRMDAYDYVLGPVTPQISYSADDPIARVDGLIIDTLMFTAPYNVTSLPAGTVCVAMSAGGMPIGVQVAGRRFDDGGVLGVLALLEAHRGFEPDYPYVSV